MPALLNARALGALIDIELRRAGGALPRDVLRTRLAVRADEVTVERAIGAAVRAGRIAVEVDEGEAIVVAVTGSGSAVANPAGGTSPARPRRRARYRRTPAERNLLAAMRAGEHHSHLAWGPGHDSHPRHGSSHRGATP